MSVTSSNEGALMFKCPERAEEFDSGFRFAPDAMTSIPSGYKMKVRCRSCLQLHEFLLSEARINSKPGGQSRN
jgi:hypothetical protein